MNVITIDFSKEPTKKQLPPVTIIQGAHIIDLGNMFAQPPLPSAGLRIIDVDNNGKNEFFISQGAVRIIPNPKWGSIKLAVGASHFCGGVGAITITAYDCNNHKVDVAMNSVAQQGIYEKMLLLASEICFIDIRGSEVALDKIDFVVD